MNEDEEYQLFRRVCDMTGHGLSDYLQDFFDDDGLRASQHGESVYYRIDGATLTVFDDWSRWRQEISYYFDGLLAEWQEQFGSVGEEEFVEVLVFKVARILGVFDSVPGDVVDVPEKEQNFMFW